MPKVSVIVPIWNVEKYLPKCLDSLINQTLKDIEIICINDGSPDNCLNILKEYQAKDNRIIIIDQKNGGLANARNSGLKIAKGEYIMFCDSDDYYKLSMCEEMYNAIVENECDMVVCSVNVSLEEDVRDIGFSKWYSLKYKGLSPITADHIKSSLVSACIKIYRSSLIKMFEINFPDGLLHEDEAFFYKYCSVCKNIFFLDKKLYNNLKRNSSIMGKINSGKINSYMDYIMNIADTFNFLRKNNLLEEKSELFFILFFKLINNRQKTYLNKKKIVKVCRILNESVSNENLNYNLLNKEQQNIIELIRLKKYSELLSVLKKIQKYQTKYNLKLFDMISLFKIMKCGSAKNSIIKRKFYILHIPILKIVKKNNKTYIKLFGFIPLFNIKY